MATTFGLRVIITSGEYLRETIENLDAELSHRVPMVAPFFGCTFGGWLYDMFLFTGEVSSQVLYQLCKSADSGQTPINSPYLGLYRFIPGMRHAYDGVDYNAEPEKVEDSPV